MLPRGAAHQAELHREPEESRERADDAGEAADALGVVLDPGGHLDRRVGAIAEAHQRVGEGLLGVHRDVAGDVVEDVGLGQVVHLVGGADGDGGGEFAAAQAVEEEEAGDVPADRLGLESGQRLQAAVDLGKPRDAVGGQVEGFDSAQEVVVGVALPARPDAVVEASPGLHDSLQNTGRKPV